MPGIAVYSSSARPIRCNPVLEENIHTSIDRILRGAMAILALAVAVPLACAKRQTTPADQTQPAPQSDRSPEVTESVAGAHQEIQLAVDAGADTLARGLLDEARRLLDDCETLRHSGAYDEALGYCRQAMTTAREAAATAGKAKKTPAVKAPPAKKKSGEKTGKGTSK